MGSLSAVAPILVLCLILIVVVYVMGVEVGVASRLQKHPGYEATRADLVL